MPSNGEIRLPPQDDHASLCALWRSVPSNTRAWSARQHRLRRLNAPYGARRFLTLRSIVQQGVQVAGLNALYGARCFLTEWHHTSKLYNDTTECTLWRSVLSHTPRTCSSRTLTSLSLNAPYGARCFLTRHRMLIARKSKLAVLMHLMALGAF